MPRQTLKSLLEEIAKVEGDNKRLSGERYALICERDGANERLKEARENFSDLKRRLHESETENARLRGYLDRVHEDDVVRDGFVEIEDEQGKRMVPKRPSQNRMVISSRVDAVSSGFDRFGREKKRTHWTGY